MLERLVEGGCIRDPSKGIHSIRVMYFMIKGYIKKAYKKYGMHPIIIFLVTTYIYFFLSCRFLDKAATKDGSISPWKLCPVTQVEETKLMLRMLPVWVTLFIPSTLISHVSTLFIKQGTTLNRHMGSHFQIPAGSLTSFFALSMVVSIIVYEKVLVRIFRRFTGNPRGITILQRMGIGIFVHMVSMAVASVTDVKRINVVKAHGLEGEAKAVSPLTVFILLPQFLLGGMAEAFVEVGKMEFFYDQAPESMQSIGTAFYASSLGFGGFLTTFFLKATTKVSGREGHTSWVLNNLNASRIYYYYAFMAILSFVNFIFFLVVSRFHVYKRETNEAFGDHSHVHPGTVMVERRVLPVDIKGHADEADSGECTEQL